MHIEKPEWYDEGGISTLHLAAHAAYEINDVDYPTLNVHVSSPSGQKYLNPTAMKELAVHLYHLALYLEQENARKPL